MKRSEKIQVAFQHERSLSLLKLPNAEIPRPHLNCYFLQETWVQSLGQEDSPGEGNGTSPGNFMDRSVWWATVHGVGKSQTGLSN